MVKRFLPICLILILCGCVRTVQKYDTYDPETRTIVSRSLGILPSESREMKSFRKVREGEGDASGVVDAFLSCRFISQGSTHFDRLVTDLNDKNKCVDSYSSIINDQVYLERFLKLLREDATIKAPTLSEKVNILQCDVPECLQQKVQSEKQVLRFVHLSDVQLRDENAKLVSHSMSRFLDSFVGSVERNTLQEYFDLEYYMALILSINALSPEAKPDFMIHTGDATDVRTSQELYPFVYMNNLLDIPWFNTVGNHDAATFGNFNNKKCSFKNVGYSFLSPGNLFHFMLMHGPTYIHDDYPLTPTNVHEDITWKKGSYFHGFDLYKGPQGASNMKRAFERVCNSTGYYSLEFEGKGVRLIVLNTSVPLINKKRNKIIKKISSKKKTEPDEEYINSIAHSTATSYCHKGKIDKRQYEWLIDELKEGEKQGHLILVFGHHPLDKENFADDSYMPLVETLSRYKVVAYFCGHTHKQSVRFIEIPSNPKEGIWEINSGSVLDYPQEGNLITLYDRGNGCGRMDVRSFGVFGQDLQDQPSDNLTLLAYEAHQGAEEDWIKDHYGANIHKETAEELEKLPKEIQLPDSLPDSLKDKLRYDNDKQCIIFTGFMKEKERNALLKLSQDPLYQKAVERLFLNSREGKPPKNNYELYFPISCQNAGGSQNPPPILPASREKEVKCIIEPHVKQPGSLQVSADPIIGGAILWRFKIRVHPDDQKRFEENPFTYRALSYLIERAGEAQKETWQLVREW